MVNCLARLHNFCIDEADRFGEVSQVEEQLPLDLENMLNKPDGYVPLTMDDNHDGIAIPAEIMDAVITLTTALEQRGGAGAQILRLKQIVSCHALSYSIMSWIVTRRVHIPMHE